MIERFCTLCRTSRKINVFDAFNQNKTRVVCGYCGTVLLTSTELQTILAELTDPYC